MKTPKIPMLPVFQYQIFLYVVTGISLAYAVSQSVIHARFKSVDRFFAIDSCGKQQTRLITDEKDTLFRTEKLTFAKLFIYHYTNYDEAVLEQTLMKAMDWVSPEVWQSQKGAVAELIKKSQATGFKQFAKATIEPVSENEFLATVEVEQFYRGQMKTNKGTIRFKIQPAERIEKINETGWQVSHIEEHWEASQN